MANLTTTDLDNGKTDLETLSTVVNSQTESTTSTRLGDTIKTLNGLTDEFEQAIINSGYQVLGSFASGVTLTAVNQVLDYDGGLYRTTEVLPYTTDGATPDLDSGEWVVASDGILSGIARSLNVLDSEVIYSTDTVTILDDVLYIYDASAQIIWFTPSNINTGDMIVSVIGDVLTTGSGSYAMTKYRQGAIAKIKFNNVDSMVNGVPLQPLVGDKCSSGLTDWIRVSDTSGDITDFYPIGVVNVVDFDVNPSDVDLVKLKQCFDVAKNEKSIYIPGSSVGATLETVTQMKVRFGEAIEYFFDGGIDISADTALEIDLNGSILRSTSATPVFTQDSGDTFGSKRLTVKDGSFIGDKLVYVNNYNRQAGVYRFKNLQLTNPNNAIQIYAQSSRSVFEDITSSSGVKLATVHVDFQVYKDMWLNGFDAISSTDSYIDTLASDLTVKDVNGIPQFTVTPRQPATSWFKILDESINARFERCRSGGENGGMALVNYEGKLIDGGQSSGVYAKTITFKNCQAQRSYSAGNDASDTGDYVSLMHMKGFPNNLHIEDTYGSNTSRYMVSPYPGMTFVDMIAYVNTNNDGWSTDNHMGLNYKIEGNFGYRGAMQTIDSNLSTWRSWVNKEIIDIFDVNRNKFRITNQSLLFVDNGVSATITIPSSMLPRIIGSTYRINAQNRALYTYDSSYREGRIVQRVPNNVSGTETLYLTETFQNVIGGIPDYLKILGAAINTDGDLVLEINTNTPSGTDKTPNYFCFEIESHFRDFESELFIQATPTTVTIN